MKRLPFSYVLFIALLGAVALNACKKSQLNQETITVEDNALAEMMLQDLFQVAMEGLAKDLDVSGKLEGLRFFLGDCVELLPSGVDSAVYPREFSFDFGPNGCAGLDGRMRRGTVSVSIDGPMREHGSFLRIATNNYSVNDVSLEAILWIENQGMNPDINTYFSFDVRDATINDDGLLVTYSASREVEWAAGMGTSVESEESIEGLLDDIFWVSGNGWGLSKDGLAYTTTIESHLVKRMDCLFFSAGTMFLEPSELKKRTIDYGDGDCDRQIWVEIGRNTYQVDLP